MFNRINNVDNVTISVIYNSIDNVKKSVIYVRRIDNTTIDYTNFFAQITDFIRYLCAFLQQCMIITGSDKEQIAQLQDNLFREIEMKDLGRLKYFLGIDVMRSKRDIFISQKKQILDLLAETGLIDCKPAETPIIVNHSLQIFDEAELTNRISYRRLVGRLIYLSHTRPDITYVVGVVSQFMHNPQKEHMEAALKIVRYLKGSLGK